MIFAFHIVKLHSDDIPKQYIVATDGPILFLRWSLKYYFIIKDFFPSNDNLFISEPDKYFLEWESFILVKGYSLSNNFSKL